MTETNSRKTHRAVEFRASYFAFLFYGQGSITPPGPIIGGSHEHRYGSAVLPGLGSPRGPGRHRGAGGLARKAIDQEGSQEDGDPARDLNDRSDDARGKRLRGKGPPALPEGHASVAGRPDRSSRRGGLRLSQSRAGGEGSVGGQRRQGRFGRDRG